MSGFHEQTKLWARQKHLTSLAKRFPITTQQLQQIAQDHITCNGSGVIIRCRRGVPSDHRPSWIDDGVAPTERERIIAKANSLRRKKELGAEIPYTYQGSPCKTCGGTERYLTMHGCVACMRKRSAEYNDREKKAKSLKQAKKSNGHK
jgi:hypothetical protein